MEAEQARRGRGARSAGLKIALVLLLLVTLAGVWWAGGGPLGLALAFAAGAESVALAVYVLGVEPLSEVVEGCGFIEDGDLSWTVPERGVGPVRRLAAFINGMAADVQEILLLLAHLVRSGQKSIPLLKRSLGPDATKEDKKRVALAVTDFEQMREMIADFKYFRVAIEDDVIVDRGVALPSTSDGEDAQKEAEADRDAPLLGPSRLGMEPEPGMKRGQ